MFNKQQAAQESQQLNNAEDIAAADNLADSIKRWGMSAPATIVLAMGRPLGFFGAQLLYVGSPMLRLLDAAIGTQWAGRASTLARMLENPDALERINARIEQGADAPPANQPPLKGEER